MQIVQTAIPEVLVIEPQVFGDERGFFSRALISRSLHSLLA